jgi:hypothetical protein
MMTSQTFRVCEKIDQNVAQTVFGQNKKITITAERSSPII